MPNVNHQFYRNSSNHTITMDADFFKKVKITFTIEHWLMNGNAKM